MQILYFLDLPFNIGGSNKVLMTQAFIMKQKGFQVKVVIPNDEKGQYDTEYDVLCEAYGLDTTTERYQISTCIEAIDILTVFQDYEGVLQLIRSYKPDLIHSTQLNIAVELAARKLRIPHLMNIYQVEKQSFSLDWLEICPQYHSADSRLMSERWKRGLGIPSRCIRVAYEPKEYTLRSNERTDKTWLHIVSIGVVYENKNQLEIIKFISKCKESGYNVKLTILGDCRNTYADICKMFVKENGLSDSVMFAGFVSRVEDYLCEADLFVLASKVESYPGVIVESMANRIPIISTPVAGIPELLKDGENGFLTDGYEAKDIFQAFLRYVEFSKTKKIAKLVENAYNTYLVNHTYATVGEQLKKYYQWIIRDYSSKKNPSLTYKDVESKINVFIDEKKIDRSNQFCMRNIWFLYHIYPILENKRIMIWGAGFWGAIALEWLEPLQEKIEFAGFIDSNKKGEYLGYPIAPNKSDVILESEVILVAVADSKAMLEIMSCLEKHSKEKNKDYFLLYNFPIRI